MKGTLRFFAVVCLGMAMLNAQANCSKCGCNRPRPQQPRPVVQPPVNSSQNVATPNVSVPSNETKIDRVCTELNNAINTINDCEKCNCGRPRPGRSNVERIQALFHECCELLLQEAHNTGDSALENQVVEIMNSMMMNHQDSRRDMDCTCARTRMTEVEMREMRALDVVDLILAIMQKEDAHYERVLSLLDTVIGAIQQCCANQV